MIIIRGLKRWLEEVAQEQVALHEIGKLRAAQVKIADEISKLQIENEDLRRSLNKAMQYIEALASYLKVSPQIGRDTEYQNEWDFPREKIVFKKK